jgi:uncharacterized protein (TIRG00374 family)
VKKKLVLGVAVSAVFLWLAARGIDWSEFGAALQRTRYWYLVPGVVFTMLGHFDRAVRWKYIMSPIKECAVRPLWSATAIATMVNNLFPARLGEFVRAFVIGRSQRVSRSASFATIVYERVVDVFVLIALLWYCMVRIPGLPEWLARSAALLIVFNVLLFVLLWAMVRWRARFRALLGRAMGPLPAATRRRLHDSANAFVDGLGVVTRPSSAMPIALHSVVAWGCAVLGVYFCVLAFRLELPLMASVFLIVLVSLVSMIPSAPAFLGTTQYACVVGLAAYGVDRSHALAFSAVYHATQFFPITAAGLYYAWRSHLRIAEISGRARD